MIIVDIEYIEIDEDIHPCMTVRIGAGQVVVNRQKYVIPQSIAWMFDEPDIVKDRLPKIAEYIGLDPLSSKDQSRIYFAINDKLDDLLAAKPYSMLYVQPAKTGEASITINGKTDYFEI